MSEIPLNQNQIQPPETVSKSDTPKSSLLDKVKDSRSVKAVLAVLAIGTSAGCAVQPAKENPEVNPIHQNSEVLSSSNPVLLISNEGKIQVADIVTQQLDTVAAGQYPVWSPDGDKISYISTSNSIGEDKDAVGNIGIYDTKTNENKILVEGKYLRPFWNDSGNNIAALLEEDDGNESLVIVDVSDISNPNVQKLPNTHFDYGDSSIIYYDGKFITAAVNSEGKLIGIEYDTKTNTVEYTDFPRHPTNEYLSKNFDSAMSQNGKVTVGVTFFEGSLIDDTNYWRPQQK